MRKLFFAFALVAILLPCAPRAMSQDVSVDFFYNNLNGGSWIEVGEYGYCWQPDVAASDPSWRPYADGYWAYTDVGWTWISYEDFGWATYHYGRWVKLGDYGWVWKPGYEWGPAWVSWRFGGGYAGWAPLPPETEAVYESRPLTGHLDIEFDIGPAYYNFVDVRYIGEPVLRSRIVPYEQNITYVTQTVNVTNITYKNKTVYNYGPDLTVVNQYSTRPVQKLKLERQTNVDVMTAAKSGGLTKVHGNALVVAAPTEIKKPAKQIAPPQVKAKVAQPKVEKGWSVAGDPNAQQQLKEKIKTQNSKNIPPPTAGANAAAVAGASASASPGVSVSPGATASAATAASPIEKGKGKGKGRGAEQFQAGASASANPTVVGAMASPSASAAIPAHGKAGKGRQVEPLGAAAATPGATAGGEEFNKPRKRKGFERQNLAPTPAGTIAPTESPNEPRGKRKEFERPETTPGSATGVNEGPQAGKHNKRLEHPGSPTGQEGGPTAGQSNTSGERRGKRQAEEPNAPPGGGQPGENQGKGKGKGHGESPTPSPQ